MRAVSPSFASLFLICCLALAGCIAPPLPQPFKPPIKQVTQSSVAAVRDVIVVPPPMASDVRRTFDLHLNRGTDPADILVLSRTPSRPAHLLEGIDRGNGKISWHLSHAAGGQIARFTTPFPSSIPDAQSVGRQVATEIVSVLVPRQVSQQAEQSALENAPDWSVDEATVGTETSFFVALPTGAPGDGNAALHAALTSLLRTNGVKVADSEASADVTIVGRIDVSAIDETAEALSLTWELLDSSQQSIATLHQSNAVPFGCLNGPWGDLAYDIALATAQSIGEALSQSQGERLP